MPFISKYAAPLSSIFIAFASLSSTSSLKSGFRFEIEFTHSFRADFLSSSSLLAFSAFIVLVSSAILTSSAFSLALSLLPLLSINSFGWLRAGLSPLSPNSAFIAFSSPFRAFSSALEFVLLALSSSAL